MKIIFNRIFILTIVIILNSFLFGCSVKDDNNVIIRANLGDGRQEFTEEKTTADSWVGSYTYSEFVEPDLNMFYIIVIYKENGEYYADISIDGFQRLERINAIVEGDNESIDLAFKEYLPDNLMEFYEEGDILLSFEKCDHEIITSWGKIQPIIPIDYSSLGEYFIKIEK